MAKDLAIILNNGGMNSLVATALAAQKYRAILLYAETGVIAPRSRWAYDQQVTHFKPYREHTLPMPFMAAVGVMERTDAPPPPDPRQFRAMPARLLELVPLVAAALKFAVHYQAAAIYLGLRVGGDGDELATATEFGQIWNELIQLPCAQAELEVVAPLLELEAWQVVDVGMQINAPFERSWSCLEQGNDPCWNCRGCRARELAFQQAVKADPLRKA